MRSHGMVVEMDSVGGRGSVVGSSVVMEAVEEEREGWLVLWRAGRDEFYVQALCQPITDTTTDELTCRGPCLSCYSVTGRRSGWSV